MRHLIRFHYILLALLLISSCSIEKRRYSSGYYMSAKSNPIKPQKNNVEPTNIENKIVENSTVTNDLFSKNIEPLPEQKETGRNTNISISSSELSSAVKTQSEQQHVQSQNEVQKFDNRNPEGLNRLDGKIEKAHAYSLSTRRKMSPILKMAIIFTGLGIIALIVSFFSWYFYVLSSMTGTSVTPLYTRLLSAGLVSIAVGLFLFIAYWLFN